MSAPLVIAAGTDVRLADDVEQREARGRKGVAQLASNRRWYLWGEPTRGLAYPHGQRPPRDHSRPPVRARAHTMDLRRMPRPVRDALAAEYPPAINAAHAAERPRTWGDCVEQGLALPGNPCPWVTCKYSLYLDTSPRNGGNIRMAFPDREPWELEHTCALRAAEQGGMTLDQVGAATNLTRERVRQIESAIFARLKRIAPNLADAAPEPRESHWSDTEPSYGGWYAAGEP